jgi:hypothetical protein
LKKDQFEKRKILKSYILTDKKCKIGRKVICFETETVVKQKFKYDEYVKGRKSCDVTIGKEYSILDYKDGKIKIESDSGKKNWFTINRFLFTLNMERLEKLKKLKNISNE